MAPKRKAMLKRPASKGAEAPIAGESIAGDGELKHPPPPTKRPAAAAVTKSRVTKAKPAAAGGPPPSKAATAATPSKAATAAPPQSPPQWGNLPSHRLTEPKFNADGDQIFWPRLSDLIDGANKGEVQYVTVPAGSQHRPS